MAESVGLENLIDFLMTCKLESLVYDMKIPLIS